MAALLAADAVMLLHGAFVGFVVFGSLLALRWPRTLWVHLPCALWGLLIAGTDVTCPLTPLEKALRVRAGQEGYAGGFLRHYLVPEGTEVLLVALALLLNGAIYWRATRRFRRLRTAPAPGAGARPRRG